MAVCMYQEAARIDREQAHAEYLSHPRFADLEEKAEQRGYRKATISEIHASATSEWWAPDLFCWQGGLWVRID